MFQGMEVTTFMGMYEDAKLHISWSVQGPLTAWPVKTSIVVSVKGWSIWLIFFEDEYMTPTIKCIYSMIWFRQVRICLLSQFYFVVDEDNSLWLCTQDQCVLPAASGYKGNPIGLWISSPLCCTAFLGTQLMSQLVLNLMQTLKIVLTSRCQEI